MSRFQRVSFFWLSFASHRYIDIAVFLSLEFASKREEVVSTNERLQNEAQAVLNVIENPDVAQSLRQDKIQNLQYLKDNFGVRARYHPT